VSARQGWLQSELSTLEEEGLIPSPVASDPSLGKHWRVQPARNCLWVDADLLRDLQLDLTLTVQCMHFHVSLVASLPASLPPRFNQRRSPIGVFRGFAFDQLLSSIYLQVLNIAFHSLAQIGYQMITIRDLNRRGRTLSSTIRVQGGPIARDHLAAIFSIVESCRKLDVPIRKYLADVLPGLADRSIQSLAELTPTTYAAKMAK
jgi:hypothetical protein